MPLLNWLNKDSATKAAAKSAYRVLEEVPELSYGDADSENLLIQGDNLEALKALIPFYAGKVKCVYVDPPFNTAQTFENYDDNLEHSIWLSLMYPRFELLHKLLSEKGVFFLHLDDNQISYATVICDEIFGINNRIFMSTFKQSSASGPKAINPGVVTTASYIVCYAKNKSSWKPNKIYVPKERDARYSKYIVNIHSPEKEWETINLREAFAVFSNVEVRDLKSKYADKYEKKLHAFVLKNSGSVIRTARVADKDVGDTAKIALARSRKKLGIFFKADRQGKEPQYFLSGEQVAFYKSKTKVIDGEITTAQPLSNIWDDLLSNNLHKEGDVKFKNGKKPESLIKRVLEMSTSAGDLVLDSFLGSGSTAAVSHKMNRRYIGIELGEHAKTHCQPRLQKVIDGEQGGISKSVYWQGGGGFKFVKLGETVFDEYGCLNPAIKFPTLAAYIWYIETRLPLTTNKASKTQHSPLIGIHNETAYYLLFNGILGDKRPSGGNVLTSKVIKLLSEFKGKKIIYGETTRLGEARLAKENIIFKQIPYEVKAL